MVFKLFRAQTKLIFFQRQKNNKLNVAVQDVTIFTQNQQSSHEHTLTISQKDVIQSKTLMQSQRKKRPKETVLLRQSLPHQNTRRNEARHGKAATVKALSFAKSCHVRYEQENSADTRLTAHTLIYFLALIYFKITTSCNTC